MNRARRILASAGLAVAMTVAGCGGGGDVIPLAKVEEPKNPPGASVKKSSKVTGSPAQLIYK